MFVGGIDTDRQPAIGHFFNGFGEAFGGVPENREIGPPGFGHLESEFVLGERLSGGKGSCHSQHSRGKNRTDLHCSSILWFYCICRFRWTRFPVGNHRPDSLVQISNYRGPTTVKNNPCTT